MHLYTRDKKQNSGLWPKNGPQIYSEKSADSNNDKCIEY